MCKDDIFIIGAGGHSKVVLSTLLAAGKKVAGFVDDNPALQGATILGYPVLGNLSFLTHQPSQAAVLAIGDNQSRKRLATTFPHLNWTTIIHPTAYIHSSVQLGKGTVVFAGAIIQPDCIIGDHAIINTAASIDHDCIIQNFVHIAPGCRLAGNVRIDEGCFIGIGSSVIPGMVIAEWSTIGAGSVVVNSISPFACAKGSPARIYKAKNPSQSNKLPVTNN